jgi:TPR repeat protein
MKSLRQRVQSAAHHGLRWFVRLRMWIAVLFVVVFGVYELTRQYQTDLVSLPGSICQDVVDWKDLKWHGKSYLDKEVKELEEQVKKEEPFALYVYALRHSDRLPATYQIKIDRTVAREYHEKAANAGLVRAKAVLALLIFKEAEKETDALKSSALILKADKLAKEAVEGQDALGMRIRGEILLFTSTKTGSGNREDEERGYRLLIKAADRGNRGAMRKLGQYTAEGRVGFTDENDRPILVQNFTQALDYYEQAALMRDYESCKLLAAAYEENRIAERDFVKAYAWNLVAVQLAPKGEAALRLKLDDLKKGPEPNSRINDLADRMSAGDLTAAQNLARSLLARIPTEKEDAERSLVKAR